MHPDALLARTLRVRADVAEIQVWALMLQGSPESRRHCESLLSATEIERASRFHHEQHREAFIFAHGLMRFVLGAYCKEDPSALRFAAGEFGKPLLENCSAGISFNLSHSHGRALLAVSAGREVGADIEQENPRTGSLAIASSYFCRSELDAIRYAPPEQQTATFFRYWAAKEAVLKAQGAGLHAPLDSFEVRFDRDLSVAQVDSLDEARVARGWVVRPLPCEPGWHAAVAALTEDWRVRVMYEA
jgi:4'-phosphopantetheinyl transferase